MYKKLIALLLVFIFTLQLPFCSYEKGRVYATGAVAGAAGAFSAAGASSVLGPLCIAVLGVAGVKIAADKITDKIEDMTAEQQEEYYNTVAENNKEAIVKLYNDGYFAGTGMEDAIRDMVAGDDTACAVSLKKFLDEKELEEGKDIKTYESGKKDDNGKNKPLVAVSGRLLDLLVDVIGDAVGNMIKDKQDASTLPYFPKWDGYGKYNYIIYKWNGNYYLLQYSGNVPGLQRDKYNTGDDYVFARYAGPNYVLKDGTWQTADFQFSSPTTSDDNGHYNFSGRVEFLYYDNSYYFYTYNRGTYVGNEKIAPNPYPWPTSGDSDDTLVKALSTLPTAEQAEKDSEMTPYNNYILFKAEPTKESGYGIIPNTTDSGYYLMWYNDIHYDGIDVNEWYDEVFRPYKRISVYATFQFWNKTSQAIFYHYNVTSNVWEIVSTCHGPASSYGVPNLRIYDCRQNFKIKFNSATLTINRYLDVAKPTSSEHYKDVIAPNPLPDLSTTQPPSVTQIVNNYFGDTSNFYEDVYNYTTNNSNNYFTENNYLLPTDMTDVAKDIILPTQTVINNTYNSIDPSITVDEDYINNVLIPSIVAGINANLKLNTDVNLPDMTIDNVMDFTGNGSDDDRWDKVTFWGLEKKFPFCLPFDLYDFLSILDAEPRAPAFTVVIPLSSFGFGLKDVSFEVDLSHFDEVMQILRTMELLGSVVGLIFITKKILF